MQKYVLGFIFSVDLSTVYLIRKDHPAWQAGLLNGVGGKINNNENPMVAMVREGCEESGYENADWNFYGHMGGPGWGCFLFNSVIAPGQEPPATRESEPIIPVAVADIIHLAPQMISNIPWLVFGALDYIRQNGKGPLFRVKYLADLNQRFTNPEFLSNYLLEICRRTPDPILCCYEKNPEECHRSVLAQYIHDQLSIEVKEWTPAS